MSQIQWIIVKRKISELKEYEKNPRKISKHDLEKLVKSIKENGFHSRLLVNTDGTIIGGHQRKKAMLQAGYKSSDEIEVLIPNRELSKEEFDRINLQDNFQYGEFDLDILSTSFDSKELENMGFSLPFLTYSKEEYERNKFGDDKDKKNHSIVECPKCGEKIIT